ncbi:4a-hydroxytetrahydrobiopterin dehydratase [Vibrio metschnikovii]|uniref:4a-hydroxytetrahydrobiopterin dehydratase n=1 Tax=Vibrio metschnikovii TaxID=28172 RepID=UPI001302E097|nr:4a-hydroxytetrahydrobiopterin dehydratase [Vibrio metschnikovii]EKO3791420.1 4a-hydroxytetrahydrobiopterin dehydratase [Vibrio metschnikovii]
MLDELRCEACDSNATALTQDQQQTLLSELDGWALVHRDGVPQLEKVYRFNNFKQAWVFSEQVANLAEAMHHHPKITLEWGKTTLTWWTHAINGLHNNDFICAARCDKLPR